MKLQEKDFIGQAMGKMAVEQLSEYAKIRLTEIEKTKRILIITVAILVVVSSIIFVFSPQDRNTISIIIGTVLLVLALGAIGASKFILKTPFAEIEIDEETTKTSHQTEKSLSTLPSEDGGITAAK